jgi:hypothetical protein
MAASTHLSAQSSPNRRPHEGSHLKEKVSEGSYVRKRVNNHIHVVCALKVIETHETLSINVNDKFQNRQVVQDFVCMACSQHAIPSEYVDM